MITLTSTELWTLLLFIILLVLLVFVVYGLFRLIRLIERIDDRSYLNEKRLHLTDKQIGVDTYSVVVKGNPSMG